MKNKYLIAIISLSLIVLLIIILFFTISYKTISADSIIGTEYQQNIQSGFYSNSYQSNNQIQKITLSFRENYSPDTVYVKVNMPVEITLDESVTGCYRNFIVAGLGISLYSKNPSYPVKFIPDKKGTFKFTCCSSNMGSGTLIVE